MREQMIQILYSKSQNHLLIGCVLLIVSLDINAVAYPLELQG